MSATAAYVDAGYKANAGNASALKCLKRDPLLLAALLPESRQAAA
jgi:hypothetical protein